MLTQTSPTIPSVSAVKVAGDHEVLVKHGTLFFDGSGGVLLRFQLLQRLSLGFDLSRVFVAGARVAFDFDPQVGQGHDYFITINTSGESYRFDFVLADSGGELGKAGK